MQSMHNKNDWEEVLQHLGAALLSYKLNIYTFVNHHGLYNISIY